MPKTKQEIKRCEVCNRFISPKSDSNFCKDHNTITIDGKDYPIEGVPKIKWNSEPLVFGDPIKPGEQNELLKFDNDKVYSKIGEDNFIDLGEFKEGVFVPNVHIPSKDDVDFKTEFVYDAVTADELKQLLSSIKMTFGGSIRYKAYLKRTNNNE